MRRFSLAAALALSLAAVPTGSARGDVVRPEVADCYNKKAGEACRSGQGACVAARCSRLDYSKGSPPRGTIEYDCLQCQADAKPTAAAVDAAKSSAKPSHSCAAAQGLGGGALGALGLLAATALLARRGRRGRRLS